MSIPHSYILSIRAAFGERGQALLEGLPDLVAHAQQRWQLDDIQRTDILSYIFVAFARRSGQDVVLKLGVPNPELTSEIAALRHFNGRGAVRLLESDAPAGVLLLERLRPGHTLISVTDDLQATEIAANVMLGLHDPAPEDSDLIDIRSWFDAFKRLRSRLHGAAGLLDEALVQRAEEIVALRLGKDDRRALLHGDLHHFNILSSDRGWLAIDPKEVIGPAACDVGALLMNPWVATGWTSDAPCLIRNRVAALAGRLGFDRRTVRDWSLGLSVLSACWSLEEGRDWHPAMQCAAALKGALHGALGPRRTGQLCIRGRVRQTKYMRPPVRKQAGGRMAKRILRYY